jgi:hypothetical protein
MKVEDFNLFSTSQMIIEIHISDADGWRGLEAERS